MNTKKTQSKYLKHISLPIKFETSLNNKIKPSNFDIEYISNFQLIKLCRELSQIKVNSKVGDLADLLINSGLAYGPRKYVKSEVSRVAKKNRYQGILISFPFKCPFPVKTNYHCGIDLGELVYLSRLAEFCRIAQDQLLIKFRFVILEEADALAGVFDITQEECNEFKNQLRSYCRILGLSKFIVIKSLEKEISLNSYNELLSEEIKKINWNDKSNSRLLNEVLPTIKLSINTNNLSLDQSRRLTLSYISQGKYNKSQIIETAIRFIGFTNLVSHSKVREKKYKGYLQFGISAKKGRVGIKPTKSKVLPHHGVPVVIDNFKKTKFTIMYFIDFINIYNNKSYHITQVHGSSDQFLFYKVRPNKVT